MNRFFIQSFGCRASQADGAALSSSLADAGMQNTAANDADLIVLNTCTVTHAADVDTRRVIRTLHTHNPAARILVTGCYAQRAPEELAQIEGVHWVVGNTHKTEIADIVSGNAPYHGQVIAGEVRALREFKATPVRDTREDRTRPNLKVQDGCGNRCSFCIIPSVRGRSRSASRESVVEQVRELSAHYAEVVLSGINLGRWGRDLGPAVRFVHLVRAILEQTAVRRLRISSVEPMDWSRELLELFAAEPRIAQHVHMPLQSGSDSVLKRMARKYRTRHYRERLELAIKLMPEAGIGADVMTGFPGETDAEFEETVRFVEQSPFTYLHVFTYSERPGTPAASMPQVPMHVRRERTKVLRSLSDRKNLEFRRRMLEKSLPAVTLEERGMALTTNFLHVHMARTEEPNHLVNVVPAALSGTGLREAGVLPEVLAV